MQSGKRSNAAVNSSGAHTGGGASGPRADPSPEDADVVAARAAAAALTPITPHHILTVILASAVVAYTLLSGNDVYTSGPRGSVILQHPYRVVAGLPTEDQPGDAQTVFSGSAIVYLSPGGARLQSIADGGGLLYSADDTVLARWTPLGAIFIGHNPASADLVRDTVGEVVYLGAPSSPSVVDNWVSSETVTLRAALGDTIRMNTVKHIEDSKLYGVQFTNGDSTRSFTWLYTDGAQVIGALSAAYIHANREASFVVGPGGYIVSPQEVSVEAHCLPIRETPSPSKRLCAQYIVTKGATLYNSAGGMVTREACLDPTPICCECVLWRIADSVARVLTPPRHTDAIADYKWMADFLPNYDTNSAYQHFYALDNTCQELGETTAIGVSISPSCNSLFAEVDVKLQAVGQWLLKCYSPRQGMVQDLSAVAVS